MKCNCMTYSIIFFNFYILDESKFRTFTKSSKAFSNRNLVSTCVALWSYLDQIYFLLAHFFFFLFTWILFVNDSQQCSACLTEYLKVSKFQNEFIKSTFLPKYEPNIVRISAMYYATLQGRNILVHILGETMTSF